MPQGTLHRITLTESRSHGVIETMDRQMPYLPFDVNYRLDLLKVGDPVRYELPFYHWESTQRGAQKVRLDAERVEFLRIRNQGKETDGK